MLKTLRNGMASDPPLKSLWRFNWCNSILIPSILAVHLPELARGLSKVLGKQKAIPSQ